MKTAGELADIQFADNQARRGLTPPWANGRRAKEFRVGHGAPADRRHLQRRPRGAVPVEGLGAERAGNPPLGRRGDGQRHAAVGDEVLGRALRPALAADGRAHLRLALPRTSATCATRRRWRASRCCTRSRPRRTTPASRTGDRAERPRARDVSRAGRSARAVRAGPRSVADARTARSVQAADPRRRGGALGRAVRGHPRVRRAAAAACSRRSRPRCTTSPDGSARTSASPICSACRSPVAIDGPMQNSYLSSRCGSGHRPRGTRSSKGSTTRRRIINGVFRLDVRPAQPFPSPLTLIPTLSRSADGGRLPARHAHRHARALPARSGRTAASSTSRGTSTARSGTSCASITCGCCGTRSRGRRTNRRRSKWRDRASWTSPPGGSAIR